MPIHRSLRFAAPSALLCALAGCQAAPGDIAGARPASSPDAELGTLSVVSYSETRIQASDPDESIAFSDDVSSAGDVDGDGYDDVIIGTRYQSDGSVHIVGSAYVYNGSSSGIDTSTELKLAASDGAKGDRFGARVAGAGDIDADGYDDVVVGASGHRPGGSVYVYFGSTTGVDASTEAQITASVRKSRHMFGLSVDGAGDLDGDGYDDIVVGAAGKTATWNDGSVYVYYGTAKGIDPRREDEIFAHDGAADDHFGYDVSGIGDADGDGYDDIVAGAYHHDDNGSNSGAAYVCYGGPDGIDVDRQAELLADDGAEGDWFGHDVSGAGDLNGDGYSDLVIGAQTDDDDGLSSGSAYLYYGSNDGIEPASVQKLTAPDAEPLAWFGAAVADVGDVDGDGYDEVMVSADGAAYWVGAAYVYFGDTDGVDDSEVHEIMASDETFLFGSSLSGAGDVDADGLADLLVGVPFDNVVDDGTLELGAGYAYLFLGQTR